MRQHRDTNIANMSMNIHSQIDFYDTFMRAIEIDLENIKIASNTSMAIDLISPLLGHLIENKIDEQPIQTNKLR